MRRRRSALDEVAAKPGHDVEVSCSSYASKSSANQVSEQVLHATDLDRVLLILQGAPPRRPNRGHMPDGDIHVSRCQRILNIHVAVAGQ